MPSWQHILLFAFVALLLFGKGRISDIMGDVAKGIKEFKKGMADEPAASAKIDAPQTPIIEADKTPDKTV